MDDLQSAGPVVRVERGRADEAELAAVTVVLLSRLAAQGGPAAQSEEKPATAPWRRWERAAAYRSPHSWQ